MEIEVREGMVHLKARKSNGNLVYSQRKRLRREILLKISSSTRRRLATSRLANFDPERGQPFSLDGVHDRLRECIDLEIISNGAS